MIEFECGARALITMRGRQPLCLYCQEVGHVRMNCPNNINAIFKQKESVVERPKTTPTDTETTEKKTIEAETKENEQPEPRQKDEEGYEVVGIKKKKARKQEKKKEAEKKKADEGESDTMEKDTEVRGEKRGRETGTNEDLSPLPKK